MEKLVFVLISLLTLGGAAMAVWHRSVVHSAFSLMATLFGIAAYFVLLGADFLAVVQVLLYVGGILVLILFGLMLTKPDLKERSLIRLVATLVVVGLAVVWIGTRVSSSVQWYERLELGASAATATSDAGQVPDQSLGGSSQGDSREGTVREIGFAFLSQDGFVIPFELASVLLLVALIGAVLIARRRDPNEDLEENEEVR